MDMKCSCKFLLLIFVPVGVVVSCTEPPNPRMAELQRYYALKGDGINPPIKRVALKTTGQAGTMPDQKTAPVLSTTNAPLSTTYSVPALSTTNVPALSTDECSCAARPKHKRSGCALAALHRSQRHLPHTKVCVPMESEHSFRPVKITGNSPAILPWRGLPVSDYAPMSTAAIIDAAVARFSI